MKNKLVFTKNTNLKNSTVLITGAGGTIGSGLVKSIEAKTIIAIDISEYAIYRLQRSIKDANIHCIVGDISDPKICDMIFKKYQIDYVFNAAAYKHVDTLEDNNNTYSVIKNNILSVLNLCEHLSTVKLMIHISSDKAVNPTCTMGYTKLWCERIVQHYAKSTNTVVKIVRFGNVYNSAGSFIETLQWQIEQNIPITITDKRMKRYFLTIDDAVTLINDVISIDGDNATYILEMGEEINIVDIVSNMNKNNLPVEYIGIRPGEKLSEELVSNEESLQSTSNKLITKVFWNKINVSNFINEIVNELKSKEICTQTLNKIITTTTIL